MARLVKLTEAKQWHESNKDKEVYVNPDFVQTLREDKALRIVEIFMKGTIVHARGELEEIASLLSNNHKRVY
jgi:hypothetical protein